METAELVNIGLVAALAGAGLFILQRSSRRRAEDVVEDLQAELVELSSAGSEKKILSFKTDRSSRLILGDQFSQMGLFTTEERVNFERFRKIVPLFCALLVVGLRIVFLGGNVAGNIVWGGMGLAFGVLLVSNRKRAWSARYCRELEYFLPIVMERIVMAVEAGLDILAALEAVIMIDRRGNSAESELVENLEGPKIDPVTRLLEVVLRLTEAGLSFDRSLQEVADAVDSTAVKHAFIHLALAHKEGGELVMPLRELSDSTQLFFQERVEEDIAKLPVKATMPLLCTFAGLVICFITSPLIQVVLLTNKAMPK